MKTSPSALTALLLADAMHIQTARAELQTQPGAGRAGRPYGVLLHLLRHNEAKSPAPSN